MSTDGIPSYPKTSMDLYPKSLYVILRSPPFFHNSIRPDETKQNPMKRGFQYTYSPAGR